MSLNMDSSATFTVKLNTQPSDNVTIAVSSDDTSEGSIDSASLTFTNSNWNTNQTVRVTGVDDDSIDGDETYTILLENAISNDTNYADLDPDNVSVTNADNDIADFTIGAISGNTTEVGGSAIFLVKLATKPAADVSLPVSSSDTGEGTVSPTSLTFTSVDWNFNQTVTVTGVSDFIDDGDQSFTIILGTPSSSDPDYVGLDPINVTVINIDIDQTAPQVSAITPLDNTTDVPVGTKISVSFDEAMNTSTLTTNTEETNCSGTIQVSDTDFSTCIQMVDQPIASNNDKTFEVSPASYLSGTTVYKIRVATTAEDLIGNALSAVCTSNNGFTTLQAWKFVDGNGTDGLIKDIDRTTVAYPGLVVHNSKLYAIWTESPNPVSNDSPRAQIRVMEWDGSSTWNFIDGDSNVGINYGADHHAWHPQLVSFNSELYAIWDEWISSASMKTQIRVAKWNGISSWIFVDGNSTTGIERDYQNYPTDPRLVEFDAALFAIWLEASVSGTKPYQVRVTKWDGSETWDFVDGDGDNGINKNSTLEAESPQLTVFNSKLYATWLERPDSVSYSFQVRVAEWDGDTNWNFVDGDETTGINFNTDLRASRPQLAVYGSTLYAIWPENNSSGVSQIRVAAWDGGSNWNFVDGNGENGLNFNVALSIHSTPQLAVYNSKLYAAWSEKRVAENLDVAYQIRLAEWDGNSTWKFIGGNGSYGINKNIDKSAVYPQIAVLNSKLYVLWGEQRPSISGMTRNTARIIEGNFAEE